MKVYRCLTSEELLCLIKNENYSKYHSTEGNNTFEYEDDVNYKHFFLFDDHAEFYKPKLLAPLVGTYNIPDEIIDQYGFGMYSPISTSKNNYLYCERIPLPEIIIREENFDKNYLLAINDTFNVPNCGLKRKYINPFDRTFMVDDIEYTYADIYYELLCHIVKQYRIKPRDAINYIQKEKLREELQKFFEENKFYFEEQVKTLKRKSML